MDIIFWIKEYLKQCKFGDRKNKKYKKVFNDLNVEARFGSGKDAFVKCMGFFGGDNKFTKGYYPTFLFYMQEEFLILSYGHSVTNELEPKNIWDENIRNNRKQIKEFDVTHGKKDYSGSYVHTYYEPKFIDNDVIFYRNNEKISDQKFLAEIK